VFLGVRNKYDAFRIEVLPRWPFRVQGKEGLCGLEAGVARSLAHLFLAELTPATTKYELPAPASDPHCATPPPFELFYQRRSTTASRLGQLPDLIIANVRTAAELPPNTNGLRRRQEGHYSASAGGEQHSQFAPAVRGMLSILILLPLWHVNVSSLISENRGRTSIASRSACPSPGPA